MDRHETKERKLANQSGKSMTWLAALIHQLDAAAAIAGTMLRDPAAQEPQELLQNLIDGLARIKAQILDGTLPPPTGRTQLGIARFVTDWVDDLNGPLHRAVCEIERHYGEGAEG
jgi:hypothetical protein